MLVNGLQGDVDTIRSSRSRQRILKAKRNNIQPNRVFNFLVLSSHALNASFIIMKKLFTLLFLATASFAGSAQSSIANGAICPNITITDTKGVQHKLYDECNAGKYVIIDFFAYWCGPCMANAPKIDELYKKYGCNSGKLVVLGNECDPGGTIANLHSFDASAGLDTSFSYPSTYGLLGGATNGTTYGVSAYPTIVLIGPDKKMINNDIWPISTIAE